MDIFCRGICKASKCLLDMCQEFKIDQSKILIGIYDGQHDRFYEWLDQVDKHIIINAFDDNFAYKLAIITTTGKVNTFILRLRNNYRSWAVLKTELITHFNLAKDIVNNGK